MPIGAMSQGQKPASQVPIRSKWVLGVNCGTARKDFCGDSLSANVMKRVDVMVYALVCVSSPPRLHLGVNLMY